MGNRLHLLPFKKKKKNPWRPWSWWWQSAQFLSSWLQTWKNANWKCSPWHLLRNKHTLQSKDALFISAKATSAAHQLYGVTLFPSWFNELKRDETHSFPQDRTKALPRRITGLELEQREILMHQGCFSLLMWKDFIHETDQTVFLSRALAVSIHHLISIHLHALGNPNRFYLQVLPKKKNVLCVCIKCNFHTTFNTANILNWMLSDSCKNCSSTILKMLRFVFSSHRIDFQWKIIE